MGFIPGEFFFENVHRLIIQDITESLDEIACLIKGKAVVGFNMIDVPVIEDDHRNESNLIDVQIRVPLNQLFHPFEVPVVLPGWVICLMAFSVVIINGLFFLIRRTIDFAMPRFRLDDENAPCADDESINLSRMLGIIEPRKNEVVDDEFVLAILKGLIETDSSSFLRPAHLIIAVGMPVLFVDFLDSKSQANDNGNDGKNR